MKQEGTDEKGEINTKKDRGKRRTKGGGGGLGEKSRRLGRLELIKKKGLNQK